MLPLWRRRRGKPGSRFDDGRVLWQSPVSGPQFLIGLLDLVRLEDGKSTTPQQLGTIGALLASESIEALDEFIIELNEDFLSGHVIWYSI